MKSIVLIIAACLFATCGIAQVDVPPHVAAALRGNKSFRDYARLMTKHLDSLKTVSRDSAEIRRIDRKYKKLARQLYYLEGHLGPGGEIVNVSEKIFEAEKELSASLDAN